MSQHLRMSITSSQRPALCEARAPGRPSDGRERVLHLVAVEEDVGLAGNDRLERRLGDAGDPLQRVAHLRVLLLDLRVVREILEAAAAARRVVLARRLDPERPGGDDLGGKRLREARASPSSRARGRGRPAGRA